MDNIASALGIPIVEERNYWVVRTDGGSLYQDFLLHGYISIGWDYVTATMITEYSEERVKSIIFTALYPDAREDATAGQKISITSIYNKVRHFCIDMQIGDVVVVPSANSRELSIGLVESDVYEDDSYAARYLKENPDSEITLSNHIKRRKVKWIKSQAREVDVYLSKALYSQHTLSTMNESEGLINRSIFPIYQRESSVHTTFLAQIKEGIQVSALREFLEVIESTARDIAAQIDEPEPDDIQVKVALSSPGIIEIIGVAAGGSAAIAITMLAINQLINGGKFTIKLKRETKDGNTIDFSIESESKGLKGHAHDIRELEIDGGKVAEAAKGLNLIAGVLPEGESRLYLDVASKPQEGPDKD